MNPPYKFDLLIIGGGAAGIMAAISAKRNHPNYTIGIIDRTFALGRKILVCGAGRCNITNINLDSNVEDKYYGARKGFVKAIFDQFGYKEIVNFFNDLGVELYVERKTDIGKLFPVTDQAKTITSLLEDELERLKISVFLNTEVTSIKKEENFLIEANIIDKESNRNDRNNALSFVSMNLILSAGGKTYPALGSDGSGYSLSKTLGHSIITPVPSALPLIAKDPLLHELQGVKMEVEVTSIIENKDIKTRKDDLLFTQYGLSGPVILNVSREISIQINRLNKANVKLRLNFFPHMTKEEVKISFIKRWERRSDQTLEKSMFGIFPNKIPSVLLKIIGLDKDIAVKNLTNNEIELFVDKLTNYIIIITGTRSWNEAEFTAGGVDTLEINLNTLESLKVKGLYFCGEILDIDGDVGGYNLSWAWSSGFVAGKLQK